MRTSRASGLKPLPVKRGGGTLGPRTPGPIRLGLIGRPVSHSLSPRIFAELARLLGRKLPYKAMAVGDAELAARFSSLKRAGFRGVNVTIPHKRAVVPLLDALTPAARAIGAVNAVRFSAQGLIGHNTDAAGFLDALKDSGVSIAGHDAVLFGAGGAARAAGYALGKSRARRVRIVGRTLERAEALAEDLQRLFSGTDFSAGAPRRAFLWVNATPLGMKGFPERSPAPARMDCRFAFDLVYGRETPFLRRARALGIGRADGLAMLVAQALRAYEFWAGPLKGRRRLKDAIMERLGCH